MDRWSTSKSLKSQVSNSGGSAAVIMAWSDARMTRQGSSMLCTGPLGVDALGSHTLTFHWEAGCHSIRGSQRAIASSIWKQPHTVICLDKSAGDTSWLAKSVNLKKRKARATAAAAAAAVSFLRALELFFTSSFSRTRWHHCWISITRQSVGRGQRRGATGGGIGGGRGRGGPGV
ncbi:hypothetical protein AXG93_2997s1120 [Marchantia polymorpha subsp. ruderalis]|uniref:Uncharacterized protein n=1 Tax=Marchantia polymorpha subsp. ruderalis TaxID=1480154 RepID=A0A176VPW2_MARPO|nr:hypothetical protein AXG93_2997s1120 [Marchantia polymorpha subsp. ruderalis]